ncbi:nucleotidyltransferase domain-containing protein [Thermococcus barophilus]|uniref:Polymerase nucleotidyl transferase domain-containing protein n=1 Tax=Thermococcus barophilus (strain DSM 11836 / MP) TaxID=391623 RepID=F0LLX2_THEBM|nr:nucleotidyltransferase domain-containing protein [Thermococcus barophilus]ADT85071.1 hypothetical protein TERMP_02097 [Thermococcus barophilus MP]
MKPIITDSAKEIICNELKLPFVHSVILIGSRARGDGTAESDYDLYIVVPIILLPLLFPIIKRKEKILKEKLKADVSISPLTYSRMKRGKDTLLFHIKKEGIILCGDDIRKRITIDSPRELPNSELYQYFFDAVFYFVNSLVINHESYDHRTVNRKIAKAILYCADLKLIKKGIYAGSWKIVSELSSDKRVKNAYKIIVRASLGHPLHFDPSLIRNGRDILLEIFLELTKTDYSTKDRTIDGIIEEFESKYLFQRIGVIKRIQIALFLLLMLRNSVSRRVLKMTLFGKPLDRYLHVILLYMVLVLDPEQTTFAYKKLKGILEEFGINTKEVSPIKIWKLAREFVQQYWKIACGKIVI